MSLGHAGPTSISNIRLLLAPPNPGRAVLGERFRNEHQQHVAILIVETDAGLIRTERQRATGDGEGSVDEALGLRLPAET